MFALQAFLHRIRQTADDQQCLSSEHVKVRLTFLYYWKTKPISHNKMIFCFLMLWLLGYNIYSHISLLSPHLRPSVGHFLALFSALLPPCLFISSFLSVLSHSQHPFVYRFCFQILRTSWSCIKKCCLQWRPVCSPNPTLSMRWDTCSSNLYVHDTHKNTHIK